MDKIHRKLAAHNEFLQEGMTRRMARGHDPQGYAEGRDVPEVKIRAQMGKVILRGVITQCVIVFQLFFYEFLQPLFRFILSSRDPVDGRNAFIDTEPREDFFAVRYIQGIGAGFVPPLLKRELIDWVEVVASDDAVSEMEKLWKKGLYVGISSACAVIAGRRIKEKYPDSKILVIIPDHGFKYMSVVTHD